MRITVVVLGSIRHARARLHANALAATGDVDLVGFDGDSSTGAPYANPRIGVHPLGGRAQFRTGKGRFDGLATWVSGGWLGCRLFLRLLRLPRPDVLLIEVPPARPALPIGLRLARMRRTRVVIDWRNLAHTELAVRVGDGHRSVARLRRAERRWARRADAHLAGSTAMAAWLEREYRVHAAVVHLRVPTAPPRADAAARHDARARLSGTLGLDIRHTPLVIAPTSWSPDNDFDLLIEALERAERTLSAAAAPSPASPPTAAPPALIVLLTGRGEGRADFEQRIARRRFDRIAVRTAWLDDEEYLSALSTADLGLCLRQSSSGLDLPTAVAEFRAASVPVAVFDYAPVLSEIVTTGQEGILIRDAGGLTSLLVATAHGDDAGPVAASRRWLAAHPPEPWDQYWDRVARRTVVGTGVAG
jgi:beta-1,4-mannosyltransferase